MKYILQKDLPGIDKGAIFSEEGGIVNNKGTSIFSPGVDFTLGTLAFKFCQYDTNWFLKINETSVTIDSLTDTVQKIHNLVLEQNKVLGIEVKTEKIDNNPFSDPLE